MIKLLIAFSLIFSECYPCYIEKEIDMIYSLTELLNIRFITLVTTFCEQTSVISFRVRHLSKKNVFATLIDISELRAFFQKVNFSNVKTMIVLKVRNNDELNEISKWMKTEVPNHEEFKWVMFLSKDSNNVTEKDFDVPYDCEYFIAREYEDGYDLTEIYQIKPTTEMIHLNFGFWNYKHGLVTSGKYLYERRRNNRGVKLTMSSFSKLPCLFKMECLQLEMWYDMNELMNITTDIYPTAELESRNETIDLSSSITPFHYFDPATKYVVAPILVAEWHLYIRYEVDVSTGWAAYLKPFDRHLWFAIIFWLVLLTCGKMIMGKIYLALLNLKGFTIIDEGFTAMAIFFNQAVFIGPDIISSRIVKLSALMVSMVIIPAYSAAVISSLTVQLPKIPFTDFATFVAEGTYKLSSGYHPFAILAFKKATDPLTKKIRDNFLVPYSEFPWGPEKTLDKLCSTDKLAMLSFNYDFDKITDPPCSYLRVSETIIYIYTGIRLSPHIHHKAAMLDLIPKFRSSGLIHRAQMIVFARKTPQIHDSFEAIDLSDTRTPFAILLLGIICSWIVFILEMIVRTCSRRKTRNLATKETIIPVTPMNELVFIILKRNRTYVKKPGF